MEALVITNNPQAPEAIFPVKTIYVPGGVENVLLLTRDMVHKAHPLLSHPLPASMGMMHSPYRSVVLGAASGKMDPNHAEIAESSLEKYRFCTNHRKRNNLHDENYYEDYSKIDIQLLVIALNERFTKSPEAP